MQQSPSLMLMQPVLILLLAACPWRITILFALPPSKLCTICAFRLKAFTYGYRLAADGNALIKCDQVLLSNLNAVKFTRGCLTAFGHAFGHEHLCHAISQVGCVHEVQFLSLLTGAPLQTPLPAYWHAYLLAVCWFRMPQILMDLAM